MKLTTLCKNLALASCLLVGSSAAWSLAVGFAACVAVYFFSILIDNSCSRMKWESMLASTWMVTLLAGFLNVAYLIYFK